MKKTKKGLLISLVGVLTFLSITAPRWLAYLARTLSNFKTDRLIKKSEQKIASALQAKLELDDNIGGPITWTPPKVLSRRHQI